MNGTFVSWCADLAGGRGRPLTREEYDLAMSAWNAALWWAQHDMGRLTAHPQGWKPPAPIAEPESHSPSGREVP